MKSDSGVDVLPRLLKSVGDLVEHVVHMPDRDLSSVVKDCKTDWYMYMFSDEVLSPGLTAALPVFLENAYFDVLVMFERQLIGKGYFYGQSPRLFKGNVKLNDMIPLEIGKLTVEKALDGFVEQKQCES